MGSELLKITRLRAQRYQGNIAELARMADISPKWVHRFRQGDYSNPGVLTLERVAAALDVLEREQERNRGVVE